MLRDKLQGKDKYQVPRDKLQETSYKRQGYKIQGKSPEPCTLVSCSLQPRCRYHLLNLMPTA
jgi:hypothetical protein